MRPPKQIVEAAIRSADGNLSRAAVLLGCSRPTLYTWVYQLGLHRLAGIKVDSPDTQECKDTRVVKVGQHEKSGVKSAARNRPTLALVSTEPATREYKIPATAKITESIWKEVKKRAIDRGCTVSEYVEEALVTKLADDAGAREEGTK